MGATLDFLEKSPEFEPSTAILVSFSAASIESRRATAVDPRIRGWISVVGAADLQSMMRVISGGVDYAAGLERGVRFGLQDILGIEVDMDHAGLDAFREQIAYLEDARREMAAIQVPITWIHGRHDAWMDAERVKDALSRGDTSRRRFIEIPTGHMLKTSREALEAFQLIAGEVGRMALDRPLAATAPDLVAVEQRQRAERKRLSRPSIDTRSFWRDYLLGRDRKLGFELMTSIRPYANLMEHQVGALDLKEGHRVADLGSGTGSFPLHIARSAYRSMPLAVYQIDYLREGLQRARERLLERGSPPRLDVQYIESNLDVGAAGSSIPLGSQSVDSVLAALLVSYVSEPEALLCEIHRVLRRGGRLVLSSLRRDADMSKLYTEGLAELRAGRAREIFGRVGEKQLDDAARGYLNEASRLLDLEENGTFRFWDPQELGHIVRRAGFRLLSTSRSLGIPPQAVVLSAERL